VYENSGNEAKIKKEVKMQNENTENRVLGRALSIEEMMEVSGGSCTPSKDGCANEEGETVKCP
jgi:hypothetical protein